MNKVLILCLFGFLLLTTPGESRPPLKSKAKKPLVVFVVGDHEYSSEGTMPALAAELEKNYGMETKVLKSVPDHKGEKDIPGLEALAQADLAVFFLRWRQLPADQLAHIEAYMKSGKPMMGFRTTTHAFNYPKGHASEAWNGWAETAFGAPPGWGKAGHSHYGHTSSTDVTIIPEAAKHPVLTGITQPFHVDSWLYHVLPSYPAKGANWLLMGKSVNPEKKPAVDNPVAWTWQNQYGGRIFLTTLGHPYDFKVEQMQRLVINAVHWTLGNKVPKKWKGKMNIDVPYHGL